MPVSADDVALSVRLATDTLASAATGWDKPAGDLTWTCWETTEHIADDLVFYATQLTRRATDGWTPFRMAARREGGPEVAMFADLDAGPTGLLDMVDACGGLLTAAVRTASPEARGHHVFGTADAEGFAAMGAVEVLVHTADVAAGLGLLWHPPGDLCERVLARLFPEVEPTGDPWQTLLWATGRTALPERPQRTEWRWHSAPLERV